MTVRLLPIVLAAAIGSFGAAAAQDAKHIAYPTKDALSPFRNPTDAYAPPDEVYRLLRAMQSLADEPGAVKKFDAEGREVVDDKRWREARTELLRIGVDAGYLAQIMRLNRNVADRATAFYGAFHVVDVDLVFELIAHIPGEPERRTRELAMPRAIGFLRAHLGRRLGELSPERKEAMLKALPPLGSPMAKQRGLFRTPVDDDYLHSIPLVPFLQLLDVDAEIDQAQALWFLKEVFTIRQDAALLWLEPSLPRIRQLLLSKSAQVREQAIGLLQAIGPKDLRQPPTREDELVAWADEAAKALFPPIRNLNDTIVQLHPSPERDQIAAAAVAAFENASIGDAFSGQRKDGTRFHGVRIVTVPEALKPLAIPAEAIVTSVNGIAVTDAKVLLATVKGELARRGHPRKLLVEYVYAGEARAIEYRVM
jgi:hypothetical protein